jgi:hypothetical protein
VKLPVWGAALLIPLVPLLQRRLDAHETASDRPSERVMAAAQVRRLAPGLDLLMADMYWLRTVQYFGQQQFVQGGRDLDLLRPLIEVTTDLDPRLEVAYRYGAVFLGDPGGANRQKDAIEILEKGVRFNPLSWKLRQDLGFFHFLYRQDAVTAARVLQDAARLPSAPFWLETLAASLLRQGGHRDKAREMWLRLYEQAAEGSAMRNNARMHLLELEAVDQIDALQQGIAIFRERQGRPPASLDELRAAGLMRVPPVDPLGTPFRYDPQAGIVDLSPESKLPRAAVAAVPR